jgi:hypothetical protein
MPKPQNRLSLKRAVFVSTALHLLLASLLVTSTSLVALGGGPFSASETTETTRVSYLSIERSRRVPERRTQVRPVPAVQDRPTVAVVFHPRLRVAPHKSASHARPKTTPVRDEPTQPAPGPAREVSARPAGRIALTLATAAPERLADAIDQRAESPEPVREPTRNVETAPPTPAPTATPAPTPAAQLAETSAHGGDASSGGWGQTFEKPLVADEAALAELRSRYHAGAALVEVDDTGRAIAITLPAGLSGDVREQLEKRLRELRFVPAECNGLRCNGKLQIRI